MTFVIDDQPTLILSLFRGQTYARPRCKNSRKAEAANFNLKGKWPKNFGEYAKLWGKTFKGNFMLELE